MGNNFFKNTFIVFGCSVAAKILAFVWEAVLAALLGVSEQADAFYMTSGVMGILYPVIDIGIWKVFLPMYKTNMMQKSEGKVKRIADISLTFFFLVSIALVLFFIVFAKPIIYISAPGFSDEKAKMAIEFLRLAAPTYLLMASTSVIAAILQCHGRFFGSQVRELGTHISKIIFILIFYNQFGIYAAVYAMIIGSIFRLLIQLPFINWKWRFRPDFNFKDADIKQMIKGLPSVALTSAINHINGLVDKMIASGFVNGAVACLNYGHRLMNVFSGMISTAIGTSTYPTIVQYIAENKSEKLRELLTNIINVLSFFIVPITFFCSVFSKDLVKAAFQRGAFDSAATELTAGIFAGYCIGMLVIGLSTIITNVFYGYGDTRITLIISIIDVVLNIVLNLCLCTLLGAVGLAVATSVSAIICFFVRMFFLRKYLTVHYGPMCKEFIKILIATVVSVLSVFALLELIGVANVYVRVIIEVLLGAVVYFMLAKVLRLSTMSVAISLIRKKIKK